MSTTTMSVFELYLSSYLVSREIPLVNAVLDGGLVRFDFDNSNNQAEIAAQDFQRSDPLVPARKMLNAYRMLIARIRQVRQEVGA